VPLFCVVFFCSFFLSALIFIINKIEININIIFFYLLIFLIFSCLGVLGFPF